MLRAFLDRLVAEGVVTAAAAILEAASGRLAVGYAGRRRAGGGPVRANSFFDLASLTKAFTGALALRLDETGELPLSTRVGEVWPEAEGSIRQASMEDLLRHRGGFRRWMPTYAVCCAPEEVAARLISGEWVDAPAGTYSDLDYLLWGFSAERHLAIPYERLLQERVLDALDAEAFRWPNESAVRCVGCDLPTGREVELAASLGIPIEELPPPRLGEPQDGNCRFLGRSLGHAGLFATAAGVVQLGRLYSRAGGLLGPEAAARAAPGEDRFGIGWFGRRETVAGRVLGPGAFGHEGFTGTSLWIDPDAGLVAVLLAHRASLEVDLAPVRTEFHRLALRLDAADGAW